MSTDKEEARKKAQKNWEKAQEDIARHDEEFSKNNPDPYPKKD